MFKDQFPQVSLSRKIGMKKPSPVLGLLRVLSRNFCFTLPYKIVYKILNLFQFFLLTVGITQAKWDSSVNKRVMLYS